MTVIPDEEIMGHRSMSALTLRQKHIRQRDLRQHLDYLFHSCSGKLAAQSVLFRLTYASETLKDQGWDNYLLDAKEWKSGVVPVPSQHNGFYVVKAALNTAFAQDGPISAPGAAPLTIRTLSTNLGDNLCASSVKIFTSK